MRGAGHIDIEASPLVIVVQPQAGELTGAGDSLPGSVPYLLSFLGSAVVEAVPRDVAREITTATGVHNRRVRELGCSFADLELEAPDNLDRIACLPRRI